MNSTVIDAMFDKLSDLFGIELSDLLEEDNEIQDINLALAYRANDSNVDLESIVSFKRIVFGGEPLF